MLFFAYAEKADFSQLSVHFMKRIARFFLIVVAAASLTGCITFLTEIKVRGDGSGTMVQTMTMNPEQMKESMEGIAKQMGATTTESKEDTKKDSSKASGGGPVQGGRSQGQGRRPGPGRDVRVRGKDRHEDSRRCPRDLRLQGHQSAGRQSKARGGDGDGRRRSFFAGRPEVSVQPHAERQRSSHGRLRPRPSRRHRRNKPPHRRLRLLRRNRPSRCP